MSMRSIFADGHSSKNCPILQCTNRKGNFSTRRKNIYELPIVFHDQQLDQQVLNCLQMWAGTARLQEWKDMLQRWENANEKVEIAIVGKYVHLSDTYRSLNDALKHGGIWNNSQVELRFIDSEFLTHQDVAEKVAGCHAILVPGGFGERGIEGKIAAIQYARESKNPFFWDLFGYAVGCC